MSANRCDSSVHTQGLHTALLHGCNHFGKRSVQLSLAIFSSVPQISKIRIKRKNSSRLHDFILFQIYIKNSPHTVHTVSPNISSYFHLPAHLQQYCVPEGSAWLHSCLRIKLVCGNIPPPTNTNPSTTFYYCAP